MATNSSKGIIKAQDSQTGTTYTDKDDWRERAMGRVKARQRLDNRSTKRTHGLYIFVDDEFKTLMDAAAFRRGISMNGYARRAVAAMIAHDLGVPFEEVCGFMAIPMNYNRTYPPQYNKKPRQDTGEGFGDWHIQGLE